MALACACAACGAPSSAPLPEPVTLRVSAQPSSVPATTLRVLVGGDVVPHRPSLATPARIASALAPLVPLFGEANAVVANYETATGDPEQVAQKTMALVVTPAWMAELKSAKIAAITIANNHACDLGEEGLDATLASAKALGITAVGGDARDPWEARIVAEENGHRVCVVAWTTFVNGGTVACGPRGRVAIAAARKKDPARISNAILRAKKEQGCDAVIAVLHGGKEYMPQILLPRRQARVAAEAGADAVIIHHPHVPSPVRVITTADGRSVPVFLSVGNLVSNQGESWRAPFFPVRKDRHYVAMNAWTRLGVIADLSFTWTPGEKKGAMAWGYHLVWTDNDRSEHASATPLISVRRLDPQADRALVALLSRDKEGPLALFSSPCWLDAAGGARCR